MSRIVIAAEYCKACELCISVCPKNCIEPSETLNAYGVYPMRMREGAECIACAQCAVICPDTAIEVYRTDGARPANGARPPSAVKISSAQPPSAVLHQEETPA